MQFASLINNNLVKRSDLTLKWLGMVQYTQVQHVRMMAQQMQASHTPNSQRMTPTNDGDSPFDVILTPEEKACGEQGAKKKSVASFMSEQTKRLEEFAKEVISKLKSKKKSKDKVDWIDYSQQDQVEEVCCYKELQRIVAKVITECHPNGHSQDVDISDLLIQMGWALTCIKNQVTEQ